MADKFIFLDRDGTIIHDVHFLSKPEDIKLYDFSVDALRRLISLDFKLIIITNQSGVARGLMTEEDVQKVNRRLFEVLERHDVEIQAIYFCPYHRDGIIEKYRKDADCRKPKTGMIDQAKNEFDIDPKKSYVIGDKISDVKLAKNAGMKPILVRTGHGREEIENYNGKLDFAIEENLLEAAKLINRSKF
ncbi:MAG: D-glycero-alpha-D-manno-heptose-1,7-bisphosphate 7-phosphatase [Candidatus Zixiibacteriota bacterium]